MQQQATAPKKSGNGCLIALAVAGGLAVLLVGVAAFGVYHFANTREGKAIFGTIGGMTRLMARAAAAPGTAELRASGCDVALAIDMQEMTKLLEALSEPDAAAPAISDLGMMVVCQVRSGTAPTCDAVAQTYLAAAGPPREGLVVMVNRGQGSSATLCQTLYDPSGRKVRDVAEGSTPRLPMGE
jgi:hypothetical protein